VVALRQATVSAKSIYKVVEVLVQEGQAVKQGELMARLDDTNARAALEQSKAQVKQFQAALNAALPRSHPMARREPRSRGRGFLLGTFLASPLPVVSNWYAFPAAPRRNATIRGEGWAGSIPSSPPCRGNPLNAFGQDWATER
jgi:multidrug efflux pump subunit AcrA (membrane-fusion protein)